jgi:hypothetical protein
MEDKRGTKRSCSPAHHSVTPKPLRRCHLGLHHHRDPCWRSLRAALVRWCLSRGASKKALLIDLSSSPDEEDLIVDTSHDFEFTQTLYNELNRVILGSPDDSKIIIFSDSDEEEVCDRTTSKIRGLSPKIISGDSRRSENAQTHTNKHTIPNMKFKLKLLQIKCRALGFTKVKAPKCASKELIRVLRKRSSLTIGTRSSP